MYRELELRGDTAKMTLSKEDLELARKEVEEFKKMLAEIERRLKMVEVIKNEV